MSWTTPSREEAEEFTKAYLASEESYHEEQNCKEKCEVGGAQMSNREKVIKGLAEITDYFFDIYRNDTDSYKCEKAQEYSDCAIDAISLLKEQDKRYAMMVVDWLRDMAHNNYLDSRHMTFWDAILDIRERAQTGLENYFRDYDSDTKRQDRLVK